MTKTFCDACGKERDIAELVVGSVDKDNLVHIKIIPEVLIKTNPPEITNPDLCADCIIKAIRDSL